MKILYYFKEKNTIMDRWQRYHILGELERHGCEIKVFNPLNYAGIESANEKLLDHLRDENYDLFMTPHGSSDLYIDSLLWIKKKGIPTLLICFDNLIVPFDHRNVCKHFDLVWLTSKETEPMFIKWGAHVMFNPYAANPHFFKPQYENEIERIAFIGTPYGSRANMLNMLVENKIRVSLHASISTDNQNIDRRNKQPIWEYLTPGYNLMRHKIGRKIILGALKQKALGSAKLETENEYLEINSPVDLPELSKLYSNYAISLASTAARNTGVLKRPVNIVNLRSFEIPMCGGLQICSYFSELATYFEENKEIIFYRTNEELVEKAKFYLRQENGSVRLNMKMSARRRAEHEHTWFCRFKKVFDYFGLECQ